MTAAFEATYETRQSVCDTHGEYEEQGIQHSWSRYLRWNGCPQCNAIAEAERERQRQESEAKERQYQLERRLQTSGVPKRFQDRSFDNFIADDEPKQKALQVAKDFVEQWDDHREKGTTVIFSGKPGTGKSHLALAAGMQLFSKTSVRYLNALDLVRMVRDTWRRDSDRSETKVLDDLSTVGLLILDEIGVQYGTEGEQVILFDVLNRRYRDLRPTILLTNLGTKGMKEFIGDRSYDRLREDGIWVTFDWDSYRGSKKAAA